MRTVLPLIATVCLASCAAPAPEKKYDIANADQLQPGVSTMADAIAMFGRPVSQSSMYDGSTLLQWMYFNGTHVRSSGAHLSVLFDRNSKMVKITHRFNMGY